jgi:type I restriction enzyme S subunit
MSTSVLPINSVVSPKWKRYQRYRDSGLPWLGEIPVEWDVIPLKRLTCFVSRGNSPDYVDNSDIAIINQACIYWAGLRLFNVKYQRDVDVSGWKGRLKRGDLLINSTGTGTLGRAAIFVCDGEFIADSHVTIVRTINPLLSVDYLYYLIQSSLYQGYIYAAIVSGATNQVELSRDGLRAMPMVVPPILEQRHIATFLNRRIAKIDALIGQVNDPVLREYRAVLISSAVSGMIDVREDAPPW